MVIVALCMWIVFCLRDLCLLQTGSPDGFRWHVRWYAVSVVATAAVSCLIARNVGSARVLDAALSPPVLAISIICHLIATAVCLWLARDGNHGIGWVLALVPLPAPWIFLVMTAMRLHPAEGESAAVGLVFGVTVARLMVIGLAAGMRDHEASSEEQEFSVSFAGWSNCMAFCLVPLMIQ